MKKKLFAVLMCLVMVFSLTAVLSGCGGEEAAEEPEAEVVTLKVGMLGKDIKTACIIMAKELGYFDEENLDVQFEKVNSLPDGLTAVSMDKLDILPLRCNSKLQLYLPGNRCGHLWRHYFRGKRGYHQGR